jgi:putative transport protein
MRSFVTALRENPELAVFLTLALGFLIGRVKVGTFKLGNVVGTLLAGVIIGQIGVTVSSLVKVVFFDLFLFATGYKVGPQFFRGLGKSALPQVALTVVLCVSSLVTTVIAAKVMDYDCGTAAGLMAGAFTESTVIGTAGDAIGRLAISDAEKARLLNNIPVAYAVTYLIGTGFVVWFLSALAPKVLGFDLKAEARALEAAQGGPAASQPVGSAYQEWTRRAYRLTNGMFQKRRLHDVEASFSPDRVFVERLRRRGGILAVEPDMLLEPGDIVAVAGRRSVLVNRGAEFGDEIEDSGLLEVPLITADVVVTNAAFADRRLSDLAAEHGRGVVLQKLVRGGQEIPFNAQTIVNRGDLLRLSGNAADVERVSRAIGYVEPHSSETDVVFVGLGILVGGLVGLLSINVAGLPISLTSSGGALVMGLVFGWLRSVRPTFGRIPEPALWVFDTIGLAVFIGVVGLNAGPTFVAGLRTTGLSLVVVGFMVAVTPHFIAVLFGRYVLRMNPVFLLGSCAGAGTATAALRAVQDEAQSKLPVLGYTVPYAIGNILLTAWGPVIVLLMS